MVTNFENILTCAVCLDYFEEPKDLPCENGTHVFCEKCLVQLVEPDNTVTCPECLQKHQVPNGNVENLNNDIKIKEMIENCVCADCRIFDKFSKPCEKCGVRSCYVCICGHDDGEKCELLGTNRNVSGKLPNQCQREAMDELKGRWEKFRKKNSEQREETDRRMTKLIESLQQRKNEILKVFSNYDKYAKERIDLIRQSKQIENILKEIIKNVNSMTNEVVKLATNDVTEYEETISKKDAVLAEVVPDALGTVWSDCVEREINNFGSQITRREPGKDTNEDLVFSAEGSVYDYDPDNGWPSNTPLAEGQIQIYRSYGGRYQLQVVDKNEQILKSFAWNNQSQDAQTSKMISQVWCQVPWKLKTGDREVGYSTWIADPDRRCQFNNAMFHTHLTDTARQPVGTNLEYYRHDVVSYMPLY